MQLSMAILDVAPRRDDRAIVRKPCTLTSLHFDILILIFGFIQVKDIVNIGMVCVFVCDIESSLITSSAVVICML